MLESIQHRHRAALFRFIPRDDPSTHKHPFGNDGGPILGYFMKLVKAQVKTVTQPVQK